MEIKRVFIVGMGTMESQIGIVCARAAIKRPWWIPRLSRWRRG